MFAKFAHPVTRSSKAVSLEKTEAFLLSVQQHGYRLSYGALTLAARRLGEDHSGQIPAQRGSALVQTLPVELQPFVCRKDGGYARDVVWDCKVPSDLRQRPVIDVDCVQEAVEEWLKA